MRNTMQLAALFFTTTMMVSTASCGGIGATTSASAEGTSPGQSSGSGGAGGTSTLPGNANSAGNSNAVTCVADPTIVAADELFITKLSVVEDTVRAS